MTNRVPSQAAAIELDVVVPVHNALALARDCLVSILQDRCPTGFRLWLVDDASDACTAAFLKATATADDRVTYLRNPENLGFLRSANRGMAAGDAPFLVLVNSDVILSPGCLARMLACARSDRRIASVNPLTNRASQIDLAMPPGSNFLGVDAYLGRRHPAYPDIVTGVGFCMLLRRAALDQVGLFDEVYGHGYCEESDLCMRLTTAGWRTAIADDSYVYHRGGGSFADSRDERYRNNRIVFDQRWQAEYRRQFKQFRRADPLVGVRTDLEGPTRWNPRPHVWSTARAARQALSAQRPANATKILIKGALSLPFARSSRVCSEQVQRFARTGAPTVTYLLHNTVVAGGVLSVLQLVNELVLLGVESRAATLFLDPAVRRWSSLLSEPMVFRSSQELVQQMPATDLVVATHWTTAEWAMALVAAGRARRAVYFVQDYEPWFYPESELKAREMVAATYTQFEHLIAKSDWLCALLREHGKEPVKIPLGMNLSIYYPRDVARMPTRIVAMARPKTPRRGYETLVAALRRVVQRFPSAEVLLFGDNDLDLEGLGFPARNLGVLADQDRLAQLYSSAGVFVDASDFQGFGRCALEAMACGAAAVVTDVGGVTEYAHNERTALTVPPREPIQLAEAIVRLLRNPALRDRLAAEGGERAQTFCHKREAEQTAELFRVLARA